MVERERTKLDRLWRRDFTLATILDGRITPAVLARDIGVDRKTISAMLNAGPESVMVKPEQVGKVVMGLNVDEIYKAYLLGMVGYQLPLYPRMHVWNINLGSVGSFIDNLVGHYGMSESQIQWFGDIVATFSTRVADFITTGERKPPFADNTVTT